jgi:hypothetical protein
VHRVGVGATAADDRASHLTSRDDESILSAGRFVHLDVKFLAATGADEGRNRNGQAPRTGQPTNPL